MDAINSRNENAVLVVSAFNGVTNALIEAMDDLNGEDFKEQDIDKAFEQAKKIHNKITDEFFRGASVREAHEIYSAHYNSLRAKLLEHRKKSNVLMPAEGSFDIRDQVIGFGEKMAALYLQLYLSQKQNGSQYIHIEKVECDMSELEPGALSFSRLHHGIREGIKRALLENKTEEKIKAAADARKKVTLIFGGHVGKTPHGIAEDVGRSYSDTTAVDVALAMREQGFKVEAVRFWKDVEGVLTANPKDLPEERKGKVIKHPDVSIQEGLEMAAAGSQLMQIDALALAEGHRLDLELVNEDKPAERGTTFVNNTRVETKHAFKCIISNENIDSLTITIPQMANRKGFLREMSKIFADNDISIDGCFTEGTSVTFSIPLPQDSASREARRDKIRKIRRDLDCITVDGEIYQAQELKWTKDALACISVIGNELADKPGILSEITGVLGAWGINIKAISHGEAQTRLTMLIDNTQRKEAIQRLHAIFVEDDEAVKSDYIEHRMRQLKKLTGSFK
jgi:aspartate kinase